VAVTTGSGPFVTSVGGRPLLAVSHAGVLGGAERVLLEWLRAVDRPVVLACPPGPLAEAAAGAAFLVIALRARPLQRRGRALAAAGDLAALGLDVARLARRRRPGLIVASGRHALLAATATPRAGAPLLALAHDLAHGPLRALLRAAAAHADAVVATSAAVARSVAPRAQVIHPGVDPAAWSLPAPPPGPPLALCLGALVPWKRADLALEIAARVPGLQLDLAGAPLPGDPPNFVTALHERAARPDLAGRVRFLGALADPRPALAAAHVLLHCADREPFGLALVEALAAGRPVVAPAAGGPLEIVTPGSGRLFAPGDARAGAAALTELLSDPSAPAAARARAAAFDGAAAAAHFAAAADRVST